MVADSQNLRTAVRFLTITLPKLSLLGCQPETRPGVGAHRQETGDRVFAQGTWPDVVSNAAPPTCWPTTHRKDHKGLVHCRLGGSGSDMAQ